MRVTLSTISKFHTFDLARQLVRLGVLERLFTGRPRWKMRDEGLPFEKVSTFPVFQTVFEGVGRLGITRYPLQGRLNHLCHQTLDRYVARNIPPCDVYHALVYCGLHSGARAKDAGAKWICDAPTPHTAVQEQLLMEEYARVGLPYPEKDAALVEYELDSYHGSDRIIVGSHFARRTFVARGIPEEKVVVVPYGADLRRFHPVHVRRDDSFRVLFVGQLSVRKGIHDLARAARLAALPGLTLTFVGAVQPETSRLLAGAADVGVEVVGARPKAELPSFYSWADVMVLPSISEGFGYVICEALACGCPVIASEQTGAENIVTDGVNGFVVPIRSPEAIADRLVWLYDHLAERLAMRQAAVEAVRNLGGWDDYGDSMLDVYNNVLAQ